MRHPIKIHGLRFALVGSGPISRTPAPRTRRLIRAEILSTQIPVDSRKQSANIYATLAVTVGRVEMRSA